MTTSAATKSAILLSIAGENNLSSYGSVHIEHSSDSTFYGNCNSKEVPATTTCSASGSISGLGFTFTGSVPDVVWVSDIGLNTGGANFKNGNYYDLQLTIIHEQQHAKSPADQGSTSSEVNAYTAVIKNDNFKYASTDFQDFIKKQRDKYYEAYTHGVLLSKDVK